MSEATTENGILVELYEEEGTSLHRLVSLLGAGSSADDIMLSALASLGRRLKALVDPLERVEYLQEQVVHLARSARGANGTLLLPDVENPRQNEILKGIRSLPVRFGEVLVISHLLSVYGPELAGILRMTVRGTNRRLEEALRGLRLLVGEPAVGTAQSLSEEVTAALHASARTLHPTHADTLAAELEAMGDSSEHGVATWLAALLIVLSLGLGLWLALITSSGGGQVEVDAGDPEMSETAYVPPTPTQTESRSLPAQVRSVPVFYIGRSDGLLNLELRDLPSSGNLIHSALDATLTLAPLDPDYVSGWGPGSVISSGIVGNLLTVDLTSEAYEGITTREEALSAANQMLYTAAEISGNADLRLELLMDGGLPPEVFQLPSEGLALTGLAPMPLLWISSPKNGANVPVGQLGIVGTVKPQANPPVVTITSTEGNTVMSVTAQTAVTPDQKGWRPWSVLVELGPGTYLISATTQGPDNDGATASHTETKSITVS